MTEIEVENKELKMMRDVFSIVCWMAGSTKENEMCYYRYFLLRVLVCLLLIFHASNLVAQNTKVFTQFREEKFNGKPTQIPDYSWAGYRFGAAAIPDVKGRIFNVVDYGAKPNDNIEDRDQIQAAINAAEKNGGGIVYFPPGRYLVNEKPGRREGILITKHGIILRGSGSGPGGTELYMRNYLMPSDPQKKWSVPSMFTFKLKAGAESYVLTSVIGDAPKGGFQVAVADSSHIQRGNMIQLCMQNPKSNSDLLAGLKPWPKWSVINSSGANICEKHQVAGVQGRVVTLSEPLRMAIKASFEWRVKSLPYADAWAVEDLWFHGNFQEDFVHHKNFIHDSGWSFLSMQHPKNSWVRRIRLTDVNGGISISDGYAISVLLIRFDGNRGHFMVESGGSYGVLMGLIDDATRTGMWHGPGPSGSNAGNVLWRYRGQERSGPDFHASWPYCSLYDDSSSGLVGNGGNVDLLPNHLQDLTYWNIKELGHPYSKYDFWDPQSKDSSVEYTGVKIVYPNLIGFYGSGSTFVREHLGIYESPGRPVEPESLYEAQLQLRLRRLPEWVDEVKEEWAEYLATGHFKNPPLLDNHGVQQ